MVFTIFLSITRNFVQQGIGENLLGRIQCYAVVIEKLKDVFFLTSIFPSFVLVSYRLSVNALDCFMKKRIVFLLVRGFYV